MYKFYSSALFLFLSLLYNESMAQTRLIAWKSHSGSTGEFRFTLYTENAEEDESNFGIAPTHEVKSASLDSVIFISDSVALMVTSEYCENPFRSGQQTNLWHAGKDTVRYHPLFSKRHSLDSIRMELRKHYFFRNNVNKTVFIGYDNDKSCEDISNFGVPLAATDAPDDNHNNTGSGVFTITLLIILASISGGLISWKLYKPVGAGVAAKVI